MTEAEIDRSWKLLNITADTLLKLAQEQGQRQALGLEPWKLAFAGMGAGGALLAAGIAFAKVFL